ncbi:MAG: hypothetical protein ACE5GM_07375 [bacterium]
MKQCPHCSVYNENSASVCRVCNHSFPITRQRSLSFVRWGIIVLVLAGLSALYFWGNGRVRTSYLTRIPEGVGLELLSSAGFKTRSQEMVVEGNIKNISGKTLHKIYAIVSWYDKGKKRLSSNTAPVINLPLYDQSISPLRLVTAYKPDMESYEVSFVDASGKSFKVIDSRNK